MTGTQDEQLQAELAETLHNIKLQVAGVLEAHDLRDYQRLRTETIGLQHWLNEHRRLTGAAPQATESGPHSGV